MERSFGSSSLALTLQDTTKFRQLQEKIKNLPKCELSSSVIKRKEAIKKWNNFMEESNISWT
jgi:hypothetical protein